MTRATALALVAVLVAVAQTRSEVVIETVAVGNPGNIADTEVMEYDGTTGYGTVDYVYHIGKFEITAGQYTEFLNAVATTDTYQLYDIEMSDPLPNNYWGCNIQRCGEPGSHSYSIAPDWADRPVNHVSWGDAARFCNWMHNGQPTGLQDDSTTESGSYDLDGARFDTELIQIVREPDATWVIPTEDEWYKSAYHYNDGMTGHYHNYPTQSHVMPASEACPGVATQLTTATRI